MEQYAQQKAPQGSTMSNWCSTAIDQCYAQLISQDQTYPTDFTTAGLGFASKVQYFTRLWVDSNWKVDVQFSEEERLLFLPVNGQCDLRPVFQCRWNQVLMPEGLMNEVGHLAEVPLAQRLAYRGVMYQAVWQQVFKNMEIYFAK